MDIEKLIERLKQKDGLWCSIPSGENLIADAATALSTLQDENEKLREDLAHVTAERDAAVERIREWEKFDTYLLIYNFLTPEKWRGIKKED